MLPDAFRALEKALITVGYHVFDEFLPSLSYHELQHFVERLSEKKALQPAKVGASRQASHRPQIRTDQIYWLDTNTPPEATLPFFQAIDNIRIFLNQQLYTGLQTFEAHAALYRPGQYYKKHIDQFADNKDRRISCVYYLNREWTPEFGGELSIYSHDGARMAHILPLGNRMVCFHSDLLHEVHPALHPRYSLTGWLKSRPAEISHLGVF